MRCLALAQAWQDRGGHPIFVMAETTSALESRLLREGMQLEHLSADPGTEEDAVRTVQIANEKRSDWIVVDGYHFGADYQAAIKESACKLLFVDDNGHSERYCADLILNQNVHASESLYAWRDRGTRLLLGPQYVMLRREFLIWRKWKREIRKTGNRILIAMGGSDPENFTRQVIQALEDVHFCLEVVAVVGGSNPHLAEIEDAVARTRHSIRLARDATDMPSLMAWADMAISAAGSICWEFCALALPALLIPVAPNQVAAAESLQRLGAAKLFSGGRQFRTEGFCREDLARDAVDLMMLPAERQSLSHRSRTLVDAQGAGRVVAMLCSQTAARREEA
jgi:UDP-2,4-diacetamido-2,4,6-trideoxy-beta-L-altropyranose hydrolase